MTAPMPPCSGDAWEPMEDTCVCDGCGRDLAHVGEVHEILHHPHDRFPDLCGYGIEVEPQEKGCPGCAKYTGNGGKCLGEEGEDEALVSI